MFYTVLTRTTIYHSNEWCWLVETGWITQFVDGEIATMIKEILKPDPFGRW